VVTFGFAYTSQFIGWVDRVYNNQVTGCTDIVDLAYNVLSGMLNFTVVTAAV